MLSRGELASSSKSSGVSGCGSTSRACSSSLALSSPGEALVCRPGDTSDVGFSGTEEEFVQSPDTAGTPSEPARAEALRRLAATRGNREAAEVADRERGGEGAENREEREPYQSGTLVTATNVPGVPDLDAERAKHRKEFDAQASPTLFVPLSRLVQLALRGSPENYGKRHRLRRSAIDALAFSHDTTSSGFAS